jgi:hypothetical protein
MMLEEQIYQEGFKAGWYDAFLGEEKSRIACQSIYGGSSYSRGYGQGYAQQIISRINRQALGTDSEGYLVLIP